MSSEKKTAVYAPDSNFFIQCKNVAEIDWSVVTDADAVLLVVLNEVHREIDRLKSSGNTRRARRARAISSELRGLIVSSQDEAVLRESGPTVSIRLGPKLDPKRDRPEDFDSASADERIAEEAKACSDSFFEGELVLLSHDGMPLRAAQLMGVQICPIPDAWLLPPEPSDQDRAIQKLNERLASLEKRGPSIALRLDGKGATCTPGKMVFYPPLSDNFISGVVDAVKAAFPIQRPSTGRATSAIENVFRGFDAEPTEAAMQEYEVAYQKWLMKLEDFISRMPGIYGHMVDPVEVCLVLSNTGSTPAEHLVIDVAARGPIRLQDPEGDEIEVPALPTAPKPRRVEGLDASFSNFRDPIANMRFNTPRIARNRHVFYWDFDEPEMNSAHCRGQCEDFRHGLSDELIHLFLKWDEPTESTVAGSIRVVVSAKNMPVSVEKIVPVRLDVEVGDSEELVRKVVLADLGVAI